ADAGRDYRQALLDRIPPAKRQPNLIPALRRDAEAMVQADRRYRAIDDLERAIAYGADDGQIWLRLAQIQEEYGNNDHVLASAYNAYRKSTDPAQRGNALFVIGRDYDRHDSYKEALAAFTAGLALTGSPKVAERVAQLKVLVSFRVIKVETHAEA